jgi:hypothetical protein
MFERAKKYDNGHGPYAVRVVGSSEYIARVVNGRYASLCLFSASRDAPRASFEMFEIASGNVVGTRDAYTARSTGMLV